MSEENTECVKPESATNIPPVQTDERVELLPRVQKVLQCWRWHLGMTMVVFAVLWGLIGAAWFVWQALTGWRGYWAFASVHFLVWVYLAWWSSETIRRYYFKAIRHTGESK